MTHIMLNLKTRGTTPGSDIRSIGACVFDPDTGRVGAEPMPGGLNPFYVATDNPISQDNWRGYFDNVGEYRKYPLHRDPRTVQWWSEQSDEAQAAFANPVDLREALVRFSTWLFDLLPKQPMTEPPVRLTDLRIWSHGSHFDVPILAAAYQAVGLPVPWHYRAPRDTRTIFDAAGIDDHSAWLAQHPGPLGIPHHALDDAICQARAVCAAWDKVNDWRLDSVDRRGHD